MGHGASRELVAERKVERKLDPELAQRLTAALEQYDQVDEKFKEARDDERTSQMSKQWGRECKRIDDELRVLAKVLITSHQLGIDVGSDGGGRDIKPWIEETNTMKWDKLYWRLELDGKVTAFTTDKVLAQVETIELVDYEWLERCAVAWALFQVQSRRGKALTG